MELVELQLDQTDGAEQIAVVLQALLSDDCCALCTDELPLLQRTYILAYSVQAHTHCFADGPISESTLVGVSVLTATQARVDASASDDGSEELLVERNHSAADFENRKLWFVHQLATLVRERPGVRRPASFSNCSRRVGYALGIVAQRPHSFDTGAATEGVLSSLPAIHQEGHTAAHRLSRWALLITAESKSLCDSLMFDRHIHLRQLLLIELIKCQPDQTDGVRQIAVLLRPVLGDDCCILRIDELPLFQSSCIPADGVLTHTIHSSDGPAAGSTLIGVSLFTAVQIGVYCRRDGKRPIRNMCGRRT